MQELMRDLAEDARDEVIRRVRRGVDLNGAGLPAKEGEGRPGVAHEDRGGIFPLLRQAQIESSEEGFALTYHPIVRSYDSGSPGPGGGPQKEPRPILGLDREQRKTYRRRVVNEVAQLGRRLGVLRG